MVVAEDAGATPCLGEGSPPSLTASPGEGSDTLRGTNAAWSLMHAVDDNDPDLAARPIAEALLASG